MSDSALELEARNFKRQVEQLRIELETAQCFHAVAVAERDYERAQRRMFQLRLERLIRAWEHEKQTRHDTGQPAQAALIIDFLKDLKALGG